MAANDDVITTRFTRASRAARNTRSAPSRAGTISSSSFFGTATGMGEATCKTYSQPVTACDHPASCSRSAATNDRRLPASAPPSLNIARTSGSRLRLRTVVRTVWPSANSCRMQKLPTNPDPPVTSTALIVASAMRLGVDESGPASSARIAPMSREDLPVFRLVDLRKIYGQGDAAVHALRGVDLDVAEGELLVLLGPSGSGKSTLLNVVGGLDRPSAGSCFFRETDLASAADADVTQYRREHVGFVFQFYNLIASLTAQENVELVTEVAPNPMPAPEALELVGLGKRLHHFPAQLSGGEQQRVAIARAIAKRPTVLLCD